MRRPVLVTLVVLGSLISLIGSTGLFAALTDTARTGTNSVDSAAEASSADIQLATATADTLTVTCGATFSENLTAGFFTVSDVAPGYNNLALFCIRNVGTHPVSLFGTADELTDLDTACTGDEALYDTTTCGGDLAGELSDVLMVEYRAFDCTYSAMFNPGLGSTLRANATTAINFDTELAVGATECYAAVIQYPDTTAADAVQAAQSDTVTWRFEFTADAS
jgi:hypothetical protein